jgi:hypothetical protein
MKRSLAASSLKLMFVVGPAVLCMTTSGCTKYYKVTDPTTNKTYYTTDLDQKNGGTVTLKDARTGNKVTVQNSEIDEIKKEEFESGKSAPPATPPANPAAGTAQPSAAAPAPAAAPQDPSNPFK